MGSKQFTISAAIEIMLRGGSVLTEAREGIGSYTLSLRELAAQEKIAAAEAAKQEAAMQRQADQAERAAQKIAAAQARAAEQAAKAAEREEAKQEAAAQKLSASMIRWARATAAEQEREAERVTASAEREAAKQEASAQRLSASLIRWTKQTEAEQERAQERLSVSLVRWQRQNESMEARKASQAAKAAEKEAAGNTPAAKLAAASPALSTIGNGMLLAGAGLGYGLVKATEDASAFQKKMSEVAANTNMGAKEIDAMGAAVKRMSAETGADTNQLADGWMHISNLFSTMHPEDKVLILNAAMKSAVSTGGDVGKVTNVLAGLMKEYNIPAAQAAHTMDILHLAAARGNITLEELVEGGSKAIGMAANLGVGFDEVLASISALSQHGFPQAGEAATQVIGVMSHIANPSSGARKELEALSRTTGIDLVSAMSASTLRTKGLGFVMAELAQASKTAPEEIFKLVPALRGGLGALALTGTAMKDYTDSIAAMRGVTESNSPTQEAFQRYLGLSSTQAKIAEAQVKNLAISLGTGLLPIVGTLAHGLSVLVGWFNALPQPLKTGIAWIGGLGAVALIVGGVVAKLAGAITAIAEGWAALSALDLAGPLLAMGAAGWVAMAPFLPLIAVIGAIALGGYAIAYAVHAIIEKIGILKAQNETKQTDDSLNRMRTSLETARSISAKGGSSAALSKALFDAALSARAADVSGGSEPGTEGYRKHVVVIHTDGHLGSDYVDSKINSFANGFEGATVTPS